MVLTPSHWPRPLVQGLPPKVTNQSPFTSITEVKEKEKKERETETERQTLRVDLQLKCELGDCEQPLSICHVQVKEIAHLLRQKSEADV